MFNSPAAKDYFHVDFLLGNRSDAGLLFDYAQHIQYLCIDFLQEPFYADEHFEAWAKRCIELVDAITGCFPSENILLFEFYLAERYELAGNPYYFPDLDRIRKQNALLKQKYSFFKEKIQCIHSFSLDPDEEPLLCYNDRYNKGGCHPHHYNQDAYRAIAEQVLQRVRDYSFDIEDRAGINTSSAGHKIVFYGAGEHAKKNLERWIEEGTIPSFFIDNDPDKHFSSIKGDKPDNKAFDVLPFSKLKSYESYTLFLSVSRENVINVRNWLVDKGIPHDRINLLDKDAEDIDKEIFREDASFFSDKYRIMRDWMYKKSISRPLDRYLKQMGYEKVALYGFSEIAAGEIARLLLWELQECGINVECIIDPQPERTFAEVPVVGPTDKLPELDAIIVCHNLHQIQSQFMGTGIPVISIVKLIFEA